MKRTTNKVLIRSLILLTGMALVSLLSSCGTNSPHNGVFPFSLMEKPLSQRAVAQKTRTTGQSPQTMQEIARYNFEKSPSPSDLNKIKKQIQPGDVIAFYMSHQKARQYLRRGAVQKIAYEPFRYGHITIAVPDPAIDLQQQDRSDIKLLQVAMRQSINATDGLDYLDDKSWVLLRPPSGSIDQKKLHSFTREVIVKGQSPKKAYHYTAALGLWNGQIHPVAPSQISDQYTCTTLIVAALNYSGFHLHSARRHGLLDIITPRQVVDSFGVKNN